MVYMTHLPCPPPLLEKRKTQKAIQTFLTYHNLVLAKKGRFTYYLIQPQTSVKKMKSKIKHKRLITRYILIPKNGQKQI